MGGEGEGAIEGKVFLATGGQFEEVKPKVNSSAVLTLFCDKHSSSFVEDDDGVPWLVGAQNGHRKKDHLTKDVTCAIVIFSLQHTIHPSVLLP
jgi:hypothetical protein